MPQVLDNLVNLIDAKTVETSDNNHRRHLGGSIIGQACERQTWYNFRWVKRPKFEGRILRLFNRGHREEFNLVELLRSIGIEVREYSQRLIWNKEKSKYSLRDWDEPFKEQAAQLDVTGDPVHVSRAADMGVKLQQWRVSEIDNHFGGSLDGIATNVPGFDPEDEFLLEFKTHNTKSFVNLRKEGVALAKPQHFQQMQIYMHLKNLQGAVYVAINKNDDDLHIEYIPYDEMTAAGILAKAREIIYAETAPRRISDSIFNFNCQWCDFKGICHSAHPVETNCRSCKNAEPAAKGEWFCKKWDSLIPIDEIPKGCNAHEQLTD